MTREERLFAAIGGADEALLERSERRHRSVWRAWGAGLAACLLLAALLWAALPQAPGTEQGGPSNVPPTQGNLPEEVTPPSHGQQSQGEVSVHFLQFRVPTEEPAFRIYINKESYDSWEQDGVYVIRPYQQPEGTPECRLEISHMAETTAAEAAEQIKAQLENQYEQVEEPAGPPNGWYTVAEDERCLFAQDGTEWDDAQREVWIRPDGQGGVFILTSSYFLEATEGHGARFVDMMRSFSAETWQDPDRPFQSDWEEALRTGAQRLAEAVFANDLSGAEDLLAPDAKITGYGEDVSADVSMVCIDCSVSDGAEPTTATVSVKHRLGGEEPYAFLTIEFTLREGRWQADWAGLEK